jgi:hypothetical protein
MKNELWGGLPRAAVVLGAAGAAMLLGAASAAMLLGAAGAARAQSLTIDDFTTGPTSIELNGSRQSNDLEKVTHQRGSGILGGKRLTSLLMQQVDNLWLQNANVQVKPANANTPAAFVFSEGYQVDSIGAMSWGYSSDPKHQLKPHVDLTPYDRIRASFLSVNGNVDYVFDAFNADTNNFDEWACDVPASQVPITVDMPFANGEGTLDFSNVAALYAEFESFNQGGQDFAITSLQFMPAGTPPADVTCPPVGPKRRTPPRLAPEP